MNVTPYVEMLRTQLAAVAAVGGPETEALAERLAAALDSAARLAVQQAVCEAADEISAGLAPGAVAVRLRTPELDFEVTAPLAGAGDAAAAPSGATMTSGAASPPAVPVDADTATARMTFRPPEPLKVRIEDAAERAGLSVNAFLVRTLTAALDEPAPSRTEPGRQSGTVTGWYR